MDREAVVQGVAELLREVDREQIPSIVAEATARLGLAISAEQVNPPVSEGKKRFLKFVGTIELPALTDTWNAMDRFKKNMSDEAFVKIREVGSNFTSCFGKMVVGTHPGSTLSYHTLSKNMYDSDIIDELDGEAKVEVSLGEVWSFMEQHGQGKKGELFRDGKANIFYVRGCDRVLRALRVYWDDRGWYVGALEVGSNDWDEGGRVFVRNSIPAA